MKARVTGSGGSQTDEGKEKTEVVAVEVILLPSLSETACTLTVAYLPVLGDRNILMSYFIGLFQEVSPRRQSLLQYFQSYRGKLYGGTRPAFPLL